MEQDDDICLPADTLKILNEFLLEKVQRQQDELENIQNKAGKAAEFEEDWQLSQFWYSEATKQNLGRILKCLVNEKSSQNSISVALLSCPSLFKTVKDLHDNVKIFEYDKRFEAFGSDFVFYDFNEANTPTHLDEFVDTFDIIIADPPFLSEECIAKISKIICKIKKTDAKIIFCSGEIVEPWLKQTLSLHKCKFRPEHERNLGNEFASYANFDMDALTES